MLPPQQDPSAFTDKQAAIYDAYLVPAIFAAAADVLLTRATPKTGENVLDVACGTGVVARHAAARVGNQGSIYGIDIDPDMINIARQIPPPTGAPIFWHEGDAHALPFSDRRFDLVLCQHGLQFFDRPAVALAEMKRVLVPDGRLAFSVFEAFSENGIYQTFDRFVLSHIGLSLFSQSFGFGGLAHLNALLSSAGFRKFEVVRRKHFARFLSPEIFIRMTLLGTAAVDALVNLGTAERETLVAALMADMAATLEAHTVDGHLIFPLSIIVGRAHA